MQHLGVLLLISSSLCEMQKTIKVEKLSFPWFGFPLGHAANLSLDVGDKKEVTLCMKFRTFAYNEGYGQPFKVYRECPEGESCEDNFSWDFMVGWKTGMEEDGKQAIQTILDFSHDNQTSYEQVLQRVEKALWHSVLLDDWIELFEWQSACYSWSVVERRELLFVNGKFAFGYEWSKQFKKGWSNYPLRLILMSNWRGEATDVNIYDSFFDEDEMISWTTSCGSPAGGRILSWEPEIYNLTNNEEIKTVLSEVASDDLCRRQTADQDILEVFDNGIGKSAIQGEQYCERLNGQLAMVPTSEEEAFEILKKLNEHTRKQNITGYFNTWVSGRADLEGTEFVETRNGYNVYPKNGKWMVKDPKTNEILGLPFPADLAIDTHSKPRQMCFVVGHWTTTKTISSFEKIYPNGKPCPKDVKDCINYFSVGYLMCDVTSFPTLGLMCKFKKRLRLRLKGLCENTKVDNDYLLLGYDVLEEGRSQEKMYGGSTGWLLAYDKEQTSWQLRHQHYSHLTLTMEDKDQLPVGLHSWSAANNTCTLGQTARLDFFSKMSLILLFSIQLQLSACHHNQFTCRNGDCVSIRSRCDNVEVSDRGFFLENKNKDTPFRIVLTAVMKKIAEQFPLMGKNI